MTPPQCSCKLGISVRHCTHMERARLANISLSRYSPTSQPAPSPQLCLSRWGVPSSTAAMPAPTLAAWPMCHHLLPEQVQGDKPWKPLLQQCYLSTTTTRNSQLIMDRLRGCQLQQTWLELWVLFNLGSVQLSTGHLA